MKVLKRSTATRIRILACLLVLVAAGPVLAGDANLFLGQRFQSDDSLEAAGLDTPAQLGVAVSFDFDWPVSVALDLMTSSDDNSETLAGPIFSTIIDTEVKTLELDVGVRKYWGEKARPYVGGGVAWVQLDARQTETVLSSTSLIVDDSDSGLGYWINGGFVYVIGKHLNVGVDLRYVDSDVDLTPEGNVGSLKLDSGGVAAGVLVGYHW